ncbi:retrotransposon protein, putative, ty1-copia subclass, partial [Tanacetum coccineum]
MNAEMQSIKDNQVWCLVGLPPNGKTVGSKLIFKKKTDMDDIVHTYKARLVAKRFTQTYRVDYEETFSPVAGIRAIRILIAIVTFYDCFVDPKHPKRVCKLQRSIYGHKQTSRSWNKRLDEEIKILILLKILMSHVYIKRMDNSKYGNIPMQERFDLNETQGASTPREVKWMQNVPYASAVGSI